MAEVGGAKSSSKYSNCCTGEAFRLMYSCETDRGYVPTMTRPMHSKNMHDQDLLIKEA
jgi:hypothetical protein